MIGVVSNGGGGGDAAGLSNGKAAAAATEDQTTTADNESGSGGSPSRKAPPPPKPTSVATKETVSLFRSIYLKAFVHCLTKIKAKRRVQSQTIPVTVASLTVTLFQIPH